MVQLTVLVVEDEPLIRMMLVNALEDDGYNVLEASSALEAVAVLGLGQLDAIITDIDMPGSLNGLDVANLAQSLPRPIPTIVTSGGRLVEENMLPGNARFISKPYTMTAMLELLEHVIAAADGCDSVRRERRA